MSDTAFNGLGMDIYRAERLAQKHGFDSCTMTCLNEKGGILTGKWLDAYFGCFQPEGVDGFVLVSDLAAAGYRCLALFGPDGRHIGPTTDAKEG